MTALLNDFAAWALKQREDAHDKAQSVDFAPRKRANFLFEQFDAALYVLTLYRDHLALNRGAEG